MCERDRSAVARALAGVADGVWEVRSPGRPPCRLAAAPGSRRLTERYPALPGVEVCLQYALGPAFAPCRREGGILEAGHCRRGQLGWAARGGALCLGPGDVYLQGPGPCESARLTLPLGYYQGVSVCIDLQALAAHCPPLLARADFSADALAEAFCGAWPLGLAAGEATEALFTPLYRLPAEEGPRLALCGLKAMELLLYLQGLAACPPARAPLSGGEIRQAALVRQVRDFLAEHLDRHYTIEELARRYAINTSSLKAAFKAAYGVPLAAYAKQCRMRRAMELLAGTDLPVAEVARRVGYTSQSKFTRAFKAGAGVLPTAYRRQAQCPAVSAAGEALGREKEETGAKSGANDRKPPRDVL